METPKISYTGIVLTEKSRNMLLGLVGWHAPPEWEKITHHVTINLGPICRILNPDLEIGSTVSLYVTAFAMDEKVLAVHVDTNIMTINQHPHVTIACNFSDGGKPKDSNNLVDWQSLSVPFFIEGVVQEVPISVN